jgi:hypothetical protein
MPVPAYIPVLKPFSIQLLARIRLTGVIKAIHPYINHIISVFI